MVRLFKQFLFMGIFFRNRVYYSRHHVYLVMSLKSNCVKGAFGDIIAKPFTNIQYVHVQRKSFEDVEILLKSDTGGIGPCERGKVVITLHLRQRCYFTFSRYYLDQQGSQQDGSKVVHGKLVCVLELSRLW